MQTEQITINVDSETARAYRRSGEQDQRKLDFLLSLRLQEAFRTDTSLEELMRGISRKAMERGMTPEILESILSEP